MCSEWGYIPNELSNPNVHEAQFYYLFFVIGILILVAAGHQVYATVKNSVDNANQRAQSAEHIAKIALLEREQAVSDRDRAVFESIQARTEKEKAVSERDKALVDRDKAKTDLEQAVETGTNYFKAAEVAHAAADKSRKQADAANGLVRVISRMLSCVDGDFHAAKEYLEIFCKKHAVSKIDHARIWAHVVLINKKVRSNTESHARTLAKVEIEAVEKRHAAELRNLEAEFRAEQLVSKEALVQLQERSIKIAQSLYKRKDFKAEGAVVQTDSETKVCEASEATLKHSFTTAKIASREDPKASKDSKICKPKVGNQQIRSVKASSETQKTDAKIDKKNDATEDAIMKLPADFDKTLRTSTGAKPMHTAKPKIIQDAPRASLKGLQGNICEGRCAKDAELRLTEVTQKLKVVEETYKRKSTDLESQIDKFQEVIHVKDSEILELSGKLEDMSAEKDEASQKFKNLLEVARQLKKAEETSKGKATDLESQINELKENLRVKDSRILQLEDTCAEKDKAAQEYKHLFEGEERRADGAQVQYEGLVQEMQQLEKNHSLKISSLEENKKTDLECHVAKLRESMRIKDSKILELSGKIEEICAEKDTAIQRYKSLSEKEQRRADGAQIRCEKTMQQLQSLEENHSAKISNLEQRIKTLQKTDSMKGGKICELDNKLLETSKEKDDAVLLAGSVKGPMRLVLVKSEMLWKRVATIQEGIIKIKKQLSIPSILETCIQDAVAMSQELISVLKGCGPFPNSERTEEHGDEMIDPNPVRSRLPPPEGKHSQAKTTCRKCLWHKVSFNTWCARAKQGRVNESELEDARSGKLFLKSGIPVAEVTNAKATLKRIEELEAAKRADSATIEKLSRERGALKKQANDAKVALQKSDMRSAEQRREKEEEMKELRKRLEAAEGELTTLKKNAEQEIKSFKRQLSTKSSSFGAGQKAIREGTGKESREFFVDRRKIFVKTKNFVESSSQPESRKRSRIPSSAASNSAKAGEDSEDNGQPVQPPAKKFQHWSEPSSETPAK
ncbi:hypothetical protein HDU96_007400 [Phlyctochytrium bullatum]|nr:hypothetical protein HDU96_007400 [Phlyctochytrium bullatum]